MKTRILMNALAASALVVSALTAFTACDEGGSGTTFIPETPAEVFTVVEDTNVMATKKHGLAVQGDYVWVAYARDASPKTLCVYRSSNTGGSFEEVVADNTLDINHTVRAAVGNTGTLYVAYRHYCNDGDPSNPDNGNHLMISSMTGAATASGFASHLVYPSTGELAPWSLDIATCDTAATRFFCFTDSTDTAARCLSPDTSTVIDIDPLTSSLNDGGMAGFMVSSTTWITAYVDVNGTESTLKFAITEDSGTGWTTVDVAEFDSNSYNLDNIDITASGDTIIISYFNGSDDTVYAKTLVYDSGTSTWIVSSAKEIAEANDDMTSLAVSTGYVNLVFTSNNGEKLRIARSSNDGASWSVRTLVTLDDSGTRFPEIQAEGSNIYITYRTDDGLYLVRSSNDGETWD